MIGRHSIPAEQFAALATSGGDADTIHQLRIGQYSKNVLLVRAVMEIAAERYPDDHARSRIEDGYALLETVQRHSPETVAEVLTHPQTGFWVGRCLRELHNPADSGVPLAARLGYLGWLAAAAAVRAGRAFRITAPVHGNRAMLPTLGMCLLDQLGTPPEAAVEVEVSGPAPVLVRAADGTTVTLPADLGAETPAWAPLRRLDAESGGQRISVDIDDLDPYRGSSQLAVADRLDDAAMARYQELLDEAWALLVRLDPERAGSISAGVATLVPLADGRFANSESATSRDAFGAVILTTPNSGVLLAETLVHEFQHSKLDALLDLMPLHQARPGELFYSPARDDPRPLGGLLQGAYAYAGVADFWRRYRGVVDENDGRAAHAVVESATWREQVSRSSEVLLESGRLTPAGVDFVSGMYAQMQRWDDEDRSEQRDLARDAADDHYYRWRLNNLHPDSELVAELAAAQVAGAATPPREYQPPAPTPRPVGMKINGRVRLRQLRALVPERFAEVCADLAGSAEGRHASPADAAYVRGDHAEALAGYRKQIEAEPESTEHWAGLLLAWRRLADEDGSRLLERHPELVRAVYLAVRQRTDQAPDPQRLATWLARQPVPVAAASPVN
ncbi:HEXXH motif domain-containing protein [Micromonosporaceae bacterium B7E4]